MGKSNAHGAPAQATELLPFHPLADIFPLMEGTEFEELVADIKKNGLNEPIALFHGMVLDGRNRAHACAEAGVKPRYHQFSGNEADARAYVISMNIKRRHLTAEQRRGLIKKLLKVNPEKPDLQIAKTVNASPTTVGKVRTEMEAKGDVSKLETRTDTKGRRQVARKPRPSNRAAKKGRKSRAATAAPTSATAAPSSATAAPTTIDAAAAPSAVTPPAAAPAAPAPPAPASSKTNDLEKQIAADRKYARDLVKQDRDAAQWLRAILVNERRRGAVADALIAALKNAESSAPRNANGSATGGNDTDAVESAKATFAAADCEAAK
jgi:ParB-like chromosome segregation protein Spo0J